MFGKAHSDTTRIARATEVPCPDVLHNCFALTLERLAVFLAKVTNHNGVHCRRTSVGVVVEDNGGQQEVACNAHDCSLVPRWRRQCLERCRFIVLSPGLYY
ncbi:hypothetical protein Paride_0406 [Pseudomonas phage Paride]|nr:hypothetical protein Paride_0406 [Pseudomonas phage Paride]